MEMNVYSIFTDISGEYHYLIFYSLIPLIFTALENLGSWKFLKQVIWPLLFGVKFF